MLQVILKAQEQEYMATAKFTIPDDYPNVITKYVDSYLMYLLLGFCILIVILKQGAQILLFWGCRWAVSWCEIDMIFDLAIVTLTLKTLSRLLFDFK